MLRMIMTAVLITILLLPLSAGASNLRTIIIDSGETNYPCDGRLNWTPLIPINAPVAKAYLGLFMSPNGTNGAEAVMWANPFGQPQAALADIHELHVTPSTGIQGVSERTFSPDRVQATVVSIGIICTPGPLQGFVQVYGEVWVDTP